jgi:PKD repeat protein
MKFSPASDKLASPFQGQFFFEVMDFDNATGVLSNVMQFFNSNWNDPFAVEFSPTGRFLYGAYDPSGTGYLLQFDLSLGSAAAITAAAVTVGYYSNGYFGSLQLGPDYKLYAGEQFNDSIGVVQYPDSAGLACNFMRNGVYLGGATSNYGLPNFITSYFYFQPQPIALFNAVNDLCPGTCATFTNNSAFATSYLWSFPGAVPNVSTDANPTNICYNTPGNYGVTLIATNVNGSDTLTLNNFITVFPHPAPQGITQNADTLFAIPGATSYQWYYGGNLIPGATDYFYIAPQSGNYNVVATDGNGCEVEAVIFDVIASLENLSMENFELVLFPSPVTGFVNAKFNNDPSEKIIRIYNSIGELVYMGTNGKNDLSIDARNWSPGIYVLEVTWNNKRVSRKFTRM